MGLSRSQKRFGSFGQEKGHFPMLGFELRPSICKQSLHGLTDRMKLISALLQLFVSLLSHKDAEFIEAEQYYPTQTETLL
jgi:hypothetical protein